MAVATDAAAVLPSTRKPMSVKAAGAEMAPLQLLDEVGDQPLERLGRRFGMRRRLFQLEQGARRPVGRNGGQRLGLAAERPVERIDGIVRVAEAPCQRPPLDPGQRADRS